VHSINPLLNTASIPYPNPEGKIAHPIKSSHQI
jgi:hypothetical protein